MDWLANIYMKWVLVAVGALMLLLTGIRVAVPPRRRDGGVASTIENVQVILSVIVVVFLIIRLFLFQAFFIPSGSMEPTLMGPPTGLSGEPQGNSGDRLLVNKLIYLTRDPRRGEIVVFKAPPQADLEEKDFIKRVIGMPGETVEVVPPRLLLDGRTVLRFSTEQDARRVMVVAPSNLPLKPDDGVVEVTETEVMVDGVSGRRSIRWVPKGPPIRIVFHPDPQIRADGYTVQVNGQGLLSDPEGMIRQEGDLQRWGADAKLPLRVYSIGGQPRLVILSGKEFTYDPGHVRVNGQRLPEPYLAEDPHYQEPPLKLGRNEYFMLGDNRNNSGDSHVWGPLTRERVIGRAEIIFWPLNRLAVLEWWLLAVVALLFALYQAAQRMLAPRGR